MNKDLCLKNKLIISTTHSVILLDVEKNISKRVHVGSGLYYGITKLKEHYYIACRNNLNSYDSAKENCEIVIIDKFLQETSRISPPFLFGDVHGIAAIGNEIWCTSTSDNSVVIWNSEKDSWRKWYPVSEFGSDINHFNTIVNLSEKRIGLVAHNKGNSELYIFEQGSLDLLDSIMLGVHAHNLWLDDGAALHTCSSAEGLIVNDDNGIIQIGNFPRGIVTTGSFNYVGVSELSQRENRERTNGYVRCFDKNWQYLSDIVFPQEGMILDIFEITDSEFECDTVKGVGQENSHEVSSVDETRFLGTEQAKYWLKNSQWSKPEEYRWSIAKRSSLKIAFNHYHSALVICGYNEHYIGDIVEFYINEHLVGFHKFVTQGEFSTTIELPKHLCNTELELVISVPFLVRYNGDEQSYRKLGLAVKSIQYIR
jgi:hypothetical protein